MSKLLWSFGLIAILSFSASAHMGDGCEIPDHSELGTFIEQLDRIDEKLYTKVISFSVEHDGSGTISVYYDASGAPRAMRMKYRAADGTVTNKVLSFEDMADGKQLAYENKDFPGKALIFEKGATFHDGGKYNFKLKLRSSLDPVKYSQHALSLSGRSVLYKDKKVTSMVISPGISFFSWDGTFQDVDFK